MAAERGWSAEVDVVIGAEAIIGSAWPLDL
jgi:hypothetical protein